MNTEFPHRYECQHLVEMPSLTSTPHYYFPGASTEGGKDGLIVEVCVEKAPKWLGTFAFGTLSPKGMSGIFTTPDPNRLCVVSRGSGFLVAAADPNKWAMVRAVPIVDVRPVVAQGILVFATLTDLVAYNEAGIKWRTKRLAWDGLTLTGVTETVIAGTFYDIRKEARGTFVVDLTTGEHEGGIGRV